MPPHSEPMSEQDENPNRASLVRLLPGTWKPLDKRRFLASPRLEHRLPAAQRHRLDLVRSEVVGPVSQFLEARFEGRYDLVSLGYLVLRSLLTVDVGEISEDSL